MLIKSPSCTLAEKSTDLPFIRIRSTSVCGIPMDSIISLMDGLSLKWCSNLVFRLSKGRKLFNSSYTRKNAVFIAIENQFPEVSLSFLFEILIIRLRIPVKRTRYMAPRMIVEALLNIAAIIGEKPSMNTGVVPILWIR